MLVYDDHPLFLFFAKKRTSQKFIKELNEIDWMDRRGGLRSRGPRGPRGPRRLLNEKKDENAFICSS